MNQRIRELIKEADRKCSETRRVYDEILAELIVRECAGVNYNSPFKDGEFHAREVLEHFGIEE
jgi:hypothetical protein